MHLDTQITIALQAIMSNANIRIFLSLAKSFLCVRYQTTTRSLSRYSSYSLRHIFRFLSQQHCWLHVRLRLFKSFFYFSDRSYILAVDEVVEDKSGHSSFGKGRFYSSCHQRVIPSVCFFALSLIDVSTGSSFLLHILQVFHTEADKNRIALKKAQVKAGKARTRAGKNLPKGRKPKTLKVKTKAEENQTASFRVFKELFTSTLLALKALIPSICVTHLVADTAYGTKDYLKVAALHDCFLISKMKTNAVLYYPVVPSEKKKAGRPAVYGQKVDLNNIDKQYLKKTTLKEGVKHEYYQFFAYSKAIACLKLNIVVIITTKIGTNRNEKNQISKNIWFTNDLNLDFQLLLEYYSLRFQIEFHFRDAKQHFGLADFKNYKEQNLTNFVNMSFTMCLVSSIFLQQLQQETNNSKTSLLDLKIISNVRYMAKKIIKYLQITDSNNSYSKNIDQYVPDETINKL